MRDCTHNGSLIARPDGLECEECRQILVIVAQNDLDRLHQDLEKARRALSDCRRGITRWEG